MGGIWQTIELSEGDLELVCLPGIGGRLWDVIYEKKSLLFQNPDLDQLVPNLQSLEKLPTRSPQFKFPLWGGEKTWVAPDSAWPAGGPHPILDSGPYDVLAQDSTHVQMQSEICPLSGLQIVRTLELKRGSSFLIEHSLTNRGTVDRNVGIWSVMMIDRPATIELVGVNSDQPFSIVFGDPEDCVQTDGEHLMHKCNRPVEFKTGAMNQHGTVLIKYRNENGAVELVCTTPASRSDERFAHGHNFEVFNSKDYDYCEAEWHSPATNLAPGASISFRQEFSISSSVVDD